MPKIAVGIITYGDYTAKYLPTFLQSLSEQTANDFKLFVYDNTDDGSHANAEILRGFSLDHLIIGDGRNLGFGQAYNILITQAAQQGYEYFLLLNNDMVFESGMLDLLVRCLDANLKCAAAMPKIMRWDFANNQKTKHIDSCGLATDKYFRFFDDLQGQVDVGQADKIKKINGFTGAAALIRISALQEIRYHDEYFDESMFMYKEDCDLSLRLLLSGWQIMLVPEAIAYHDRTAAIPGRSLKEIAANRAHKSIRVKKWSFLNQLILLYKFSPLMTIRLKITAWTYELASIAFASVFETCLLREIISFWKIKNDISQKTAALSVKITKSEFSNLFDKHEA